jgi:hypothetical protein
MHEGDMIKRLRVEPISNYLERRRKGPIYPVIVANGFVYLSGLPPFDPETGDVNIARQIHRISTNSMRFTHAISRPNRPPASFCTFRHGPGRSTSRSMPWQLFSPLGKKYFSRAMDHRVKPGDDKSPK